ncbi:diaminopimelate decarboxylase [Acidipropionibacterium jensenii]|uniref:diaminopimelate decarboxylase n=1 Tax=Acidipropionibacterium jensenii TaxID=1749 RepID=UPI00110BD3E8|nr:diaminopimelate decarboxylase [Acidipropionibacterium jensenii]QCV88755.1 diaminopimelate decarboxylase [Acidipropionibacterium jensenii]
MTHMHVAGSVHADVAAAAPQWLFVPTDVNALDPALWSSTVRRRPDGALEIGGIDVRTLVDEVGTPVYVIDEQDFRQRARAFRSAFAGWDVYYAGKAFLTRTIAGWVHEEGLFLDVCTEGELRVALEGGFDPARIGMHGNNKSRRELEMALRSGVGRIIVDSLDEIDRIEELCRRHEVRARVMVRVTPGVEAHTHEYIATAHEDQKFGFSITNGAAMVAMVRCHASPVIDLLGIHSHIGSQIFDTGGFEVAARRTMKLLSQFQQATGIVLSELDLGGGFGIAYTSQDSPSSPEDLATDLRDIVETEARAHQMPAPHVSLEPGRAIVGPAGMAVYEVGTVKPVDLDGGAQRVYVSVDGGMSDNIRPALYGAEYSATLANRTSAEVGALCRVVGKHCEGGDILVRDEYLPADIHPGDLIAVPASGAYSRSMASNYNHVPRPPVVAVDQAQWTTLLRRETLDDLVGLDQGQVVGTIPQ